MRKSVVTFFFILCAISVMAKDMPKPGFGVQIGWAQPILRVNDKDHKDTLNNVTKLNGFKLGVVYDASFIAGFGSSIALNYTFGAQSSPWEKTTIYNYPRTRNFTMYHELEVVVDWQYKFEIAKETYLMLYTGPTIQCGIEYNKRQETKKEDLISGKITTERGNNNNLYTTNSQDEALKRLNITWGVGAGFQYQRYFLRGGYDFGLIVPYKNQDFSTGTHTRGRLDQWNVKIGMYLWYN